jgi:hypothetical protein
MDVQMSRRISRIIGWKILWSVGFWFSINTLALCILMVVNFGANAKLKTLWWWNDAFAVSVNLLTGGVISFLFYFLVVVIPERRKKSIIKSNLRSLYRDLKEDILLQVVFASIRGGRTDLTTNMDDLDNLMDIENFKAAFAHGRESDEGFYAFENQMNNETSEFRAIVLNLKMLSKQIEFVLHNYAIDDQKAFDFFKRLELLLMRIQDTGPGYDESKPLCRFVWQMFTGFSWAEGYRGYDPIESMIENI